MALMDLYRFGDCLDRGGTVEEGDHEFENQCRGRFTGFGNQRFTLNEQQ